MKNADHRAAMPNPALDPFRAFVGEWETVGTHPLLPDTVLHGHTSFQWLAGGAFLLMHSTNREGKIPASVAVFGSDNVKGEYFMLYVDERQVSRKCEVAVEHNVLKWWREAPEFSQRYTLEVTANGHTIVSKGELAKDGTNWEKDLVLTYTRVE